MKVTPAKIPEVLVLEPQVFTDSRGFFFESFNQRDFQSILPKGTQFVQDNHSHSVKNVLRGLHFQKENPQGKLVRVSYGAVFDVVVDVRKESKTFGQWEGFTLSGENKKILWIPPGFAHGFLVLSEEVDFLYKTTEYYDPKNEICLRWNDPHVSITWPLEGEPILSPKDSKGLFLNQISD